jgi:hypothetical protein
MVLSQRLLQRPFSTSGSRILCQLVLLFLPWILPHTSRLLAHLFPNICGRINKLRTVPACTEVKLISSQSTGRCICMLLLMCGGQAILHTASFVMNCIRSFIEQETKTVLCHRTGMSQTDMVLWDRDNQTISDRDPKHCKAYLPWKNMSHGRAAAAG